MMDGITVWLDEEETLYQASNDAWVAGGYVGTSPHRGFRCNWDTVQRFWSEGQDRIDILIVEGQPVGFVVGTDILEVKPTLRGLGYGRILADFMIKLAYDEGHSVVEIEIAPEASVPFWEHMGFTSISNRQGYGGGVYAYKALLRTFSFTGGPLVPFSVSFFTEEERYQNMEDPKPFKQFAGLGERLPDGTVQLPTRAYCFRPEDDQSTDYFVKIEANGVVLHFDKVKYAASGQYGVKCDKGYMYFLDCITPTI